MNSLGIDSLLSSSPVLLFSLKFPSVLFRCCVWLLGRISGSAPPPHLLSLLTCRFIISLTDPCYVFVWSSVDHVIQRLGCGFWTLLTTLCSLPLLELCLCSEAWLVHDLQGRGCLPACLCASPLNFSRGFVCLDQRTTRCIIYYSLNSVTPFICSPSLTFPFASERNDLKPHTLPLFQTLLLTDISSFVVVFFF